MPAHGSGTYKVGRGGRLRQEVLDLPRAAGKAFKKMEGFAPPIFLKGFPAA